MPIQWQPPYQLTNPEDRKERERQQFYQSLQNLGQAGFQNRQLNRQTEMDAFNRQLQQAAEARAQQEQAYQYGDQGPGSMGQPSMGMTPPGMIAPSASPMGPQPQGTVNWAQGMQGPQPQSTLPSPTTGQMTPTDQFMAWKLKQQAGPMDQYQQAMNLPGYKRRTEALGFMKEKAGIEESQAKADYYRRRGITGPDDGDIPVSWAINPLTGNQQPLPKRLPASAIPALASRGGTSPQIPGALSDGGLAGGPTPLPYKDRVKLEREKPKAYGSLQNTLREYDNMLAEAKAIRDDPNLKWATGIAQPLSRIPGTPAKQVSARLETLKAKTLLNVLSSLKELSSTGASGFGQLSNIEGENLRNSISTLDPQLSAADLRSSIDRFISEMQQRKSVLHNTFNETYGESGGGDGYIKTAVNKQTGQRIGTKDGQTWEPIP